MDITSFFFSLFYSLKNLLAVHLGKSNWSLYYRYKIEGFLIAYFILGKRENGKFVQPLWSCERMAYFMFLKALPLNVNLRSCCEKIVKIAGLSIKNKQSIVKCKISSMKRFERFPINYLSCVSLKRVIFHSDKFSDGTITT